MTASPPAPAGGAAPVGHGVEDGPERGPRFGGRVRWIGLALLAALAALLWAQPAWVSRIQLLWFDACQAIAPRAVSALPATIVEIDQKSIVALGQWPWPRTVLGELVREIARAKPVAIGLDILMPEADRSSPEHWLDNMPSTDADLAQSLSALPSHDTELARAIGQERGERVTLARQPIGRRLQRPPERRVILSLVAPTREERLAALAGLLQPEALRGRVRGDHRAEQPYRPRGRRQELLRPGEPRR